MVDEVYAPPAGSTIADEPLHRIFGVGNAGGFRIKGRQPDAVRLVVLYTSGHNPDWPDSLDPTTGDFVYFGDNRSPGHELHDTPRGGNRLLRTVFERSRASSEARALVPPIFLFEKAGPSREVRFRGLLAPGSPRLGAEDELVGIWRTTRAHRFQNYRAHFTVLDVSPVPRRWIDELLAGDPTGAHCPPAWRRWVAGRIYTPLQAPRTTTVRGKAAQYPAPHAMPLLRAVYEHFRARPHDFEHFAADLWLDSDPNVEAIDVTRPSRDGGRDAVGTYRVGPPTDPVRITFALEAKCYRPETSGVGVRDVARLVSRIKHRDFGVLVTTAHVGDQPYREVREDQHPVVFVTGGDIVDILARKGLRTVADVDAYLRRTYPAPSSPDVGFTPNVWIEVDGAAEAAKAAQGAPSVRDAPIVRDAGSEDGSCRHSPSLGSAGTMWSEPSG